MEPKQMTQVRGHAVHPSPEGWRYTEDDTLVTEDPARPCTHCDWVPFWIEGIGLVDRCFVEFNPIIGFRSTLPADVTWACCGHGVEDGYIRWGNLPDHTTDAVLVREETP